MLRISNNRRSSQGVTLVELVFSMAIFAIAITYTFGGFNTVLGLVATQRKVTEVQLDQDEVFLQIERDIKNAGADPLARNLFDSTVPAIELVPAGESLEGGLRCRADLTGTGDAPDGDVSDPGEVIVYALDSSTRTLNRWVSTGPSGMVAQPLLKNVTLFNPRLLDSEGHGTSADKARQVTIDMRSSIDGMDPRVNAQRRSHYFAVTIRSRLLPDL